MRRSRITEVEGKIRALSASWIIPIYTSPGKKVAARISEVSTVGGVSSIHFVWISWFQEITSSKLNRQVLHGQNLYSVVTRTLQRRHFGDASAQGKSSFPELNWTEEHALAFISKRTSEVPSKPSSRAEESSDVLLTQVERKARYLLEFESSVDYIFLSLAKFYYRIGVFCVDSWIQTVRILHHLTHGVI